MNIAGRFHLIERRDGLTVVGLIGAARAELLTPDNIAHIKGFYHVSDQPHKIVDDYPVSINRSMYNNFLIIGEEKAREIRHYTAAEWAKEQYKGRWDDTPFNRGQVEAGELPAEYIGRRTVLAYEPEHGTVLLTEGVHFTIEE